MTMTYVARRTIRTLSNGRQWSAGQYIQGTEMPANLCAALLAEGAIELVAPSAPTRRTRRNTTSGRKGG